MSVHDLESRRRARTGTLSKALSDADRAAEDARRWERRFDPGELIARIRPERAQRRGVPRFRGRTAVPPEVPTWRTDPEHGSRTRAPVPVSDPSGLVPDDERPRVGESPAEGEGGVAPADVATKPALRKRALAYAVEHRLSLGIVAALVLVSGLLHAIGLNGWPRFEEDEGTYTFQAWAVKELGSLAPYTYWYDHPPLGWLLIAGWWSTVGTIFSIDDPYAVVRSLMVLAQLVSVVLVYALGRRFGMRRGFAALAALLFSVSPLAIELQRIGFLDNLAVPFTLGAFLLASTPSRRLWSFAAAAAMFAAAVLVKETFLLLLPGLLLVFWRNTDRSTRAFCLSVAGATFGLVGGSYVLYATLKGELLPGEGHVSLWESVAFQLFERREGGSVFDPGTENGATVAYWLDLDVILPAAALLALPVTLLVRRLWPIGLALALPLAMLLRPGYVPHMYVIALLPFFGLAIAGAADWAWGRLDGLAERRRAPGLRMLPRAAVLAGLGAFALTAAGPWPGQIDRMMSEDANEPRRQAMAFAEAEIPLDANLLVEAPNWLPLVEQGRDPADVVWLYKLDHDPGVGDQFPHGWRDMDYLVISDFARNQLDVPETTRAIENSRPLAAFGTGAERIEIREVVEPKPKLARTPDRDHTPDPR